MECIKMQNWRASRSKRKSNLPKRSEKMNQNNRRLLESMSQHLG